MTKSAITEILKNRHVICDLGPQNHKGQYYEIEIYTSSESWINRVSTDVWFVTIGHNLAKIFNNLIKYFHKNLFRENAHVHLKLNDKKSQ